MIFVFESNKENTHVRITVSTGKETFDLGFRKHNLLIFQLAKKRARDLLESKVSAEEGFVYKDWLYEKIHHDDTTIVNRGIINLDYTVVNQHFSRFKKLVNQKLGNGHQEFIEHRSLNDGTEVRFLPNKIRIIESNEVIYDTCELVDLAIENLPHPSEPQNNKITVSGQKTGYFILTKFFNLHRKKITLLSLLGLVILISLVLKSLLINQPENSLLATKANSRSFVFLEPTFTTNSAIDLTRQNKLREKLHSAISAYVDVNPKIVFIQIVNDSAATISETGKRFSADDVISAEVNCNSIKNCSFSFKQYTKEQYWQVKNSFNLPLSVTDLEKVFWGVQFKLDAFYSNLSISQYAPSQGVDSNSFDQFVNIFSQWQQGIINNEQLKQLNTLNDMFPNWHFVIKTYHNILIDLYQNSKNAIYLHKLEVSMNYLEKQFQDPVHTLKLEIFLDRAREKFPNALKKVALLNQYGVSEATINYQYGLIFSEQNNWRKVADIYQESDISELKKKQFELIKLAYWHLAMYKEMEFLVDTYLDYYSNDQCAINAKITLESMQGKLDSALNRSLSLNSVGITDIETRANQANVYYLLGDTDIAYQLLLENYNAYPSDIRTIDDLGRIELLMMHPERAKNTYSRAIKIHGKTQLDQNPIKMAFAYAATEQLELAGNIIREQEILMIEMDNKNPFEHLRISEFHALYGQTTKALKHANYAISFGLNQAYFQHNIFRELCAKQIALKEGSKPKFCQSDTNKVKPSIKESNDA